MLNYILRRILYSVPLLVLVACVTFFIITLPPGDYMTALEGELVSKASLSAQEAKEISDQLREHYGLDKTIWVQFGKWFLGLLKGDLGYSFKFRKPVAEVIWTFLGWTFLIAFCSFVVSAVGGILPGIYSATNQYGIGDNLLTTLAYIGLSIPNFFLALLMMYLMVFHFEVKSVGGLFSPDMVMQPWSWAKFIDFLNHFWLPVLVIGVAGTARNMRVMRGNLLDVLDQPYVQAARAKGLSEFTVINKHAVRNAIQPIIMSFGMSLPWLIEGSLTTAYVLNLPTTGPVFLEALLSQDMYLAGSFLMVIAVVTIIGNILADIALAAVDPRVRYE